MTWTSQLIPGQQQLTVHAGKQIYGFLQIEVHEPLSTRAEINKLYYNFNKSLMNFNECLQNQFVWNLP